MIGTINLSNEKGRDAVVNFYSPPKQDKTQRVTQDGKPIQNKRYIKSPIDKSYEKLLQEHGDDVEQLAEALIATDPELDMEVAGKFLEGTSKVYINEEGEVVFSIQREEHVFDPKGNLKETREPKHLSANINKEGNPLKWSGKLLPKEKVYNKFVFVRKYQLIHDSGLKFDFLYDMAKQLHEKNAMMLIGTGKGNGPIVLREGGSPYRAFLEGRIEGNKYLLLVHISNIEFKSIPKEETE